MISGDNEKTNGILKDNCGFYGLESTTDLLEIDLGILLCGETPLPRATLPKSVTLLAARMEGLPVPLGESFRPIANGDDLPDGSA